MKETHSFIDNRKDWDMKGTSSVGFPPGEELAMT
jgi:hypothetical protein